MLSQAGGDIRVTGQAQDVDRQGAQAGEVGRAVGRANLAGVLAEDHVADPVQAGLDAPVAAHPAGQLRRVDLAGIQAGDGVDGLHAPAPAPGAPPTDDLQCLAGVGEALAVSVAAAGQVDDPDGAGLDPAVPDRVDPGGLGDVCAGQRLEPGVQRLLVALDPQNPVGAAGAQVGGQLPGGETGVDGDHRVGQQAAVIEGGGQLVGGGDLTAVAGLG